MSAVITGLVRFSYANVFEPKSINGSDPKYSIAILVPKKDTEGVKRIKEAIEAAITDGIASKFGGKKPPKMKLPLRDGDEERPDDEAYKGHYFFNASSKTSPKIVDKSLTEIIDPDEFYSGCYGRASINFYAFNTNGNKGIAAGLNNLQKIKDGVKLSGGTSPEEDFGDDFAENYDDLM